MRGKRAQERGTPLAAPRNSPLAQGEEGIKETTGAYLATADVTDTRDVVEFTEATDAIPSTLEFAECAGARDAAPGGVDDGARGGGAVPRDR